MNNQSGVLAGVSKMESCILAPKLVAIFSK